MVPSIFSLFGGKYGYFVQLFKAMTLKQSTIHYFLLPFKLKFLQQKETVKK